MVDHIEVAKYFIIKAYEDGRENQMTNMKVQKLLLEDMRLLGEEKLLEIEREHPHYSIIVSRLLKDALTPKEDPQYIQQGEVNDWLNSFLA